MLPRGLILLASVWLVVSWLLAIGLRTPLQPTSAAYTPGVRAMLLSVTIGLVIGWPLLRLSQRPTDAPIRQTILDLIVLLSLLQVVVWPLRLVTPWSPMRTAALDATIVSWTLLVGAVVASVMDSRRGGPRTFAMLVCVAICLLAPMASWLSAVGGVNLFQSMAASPLLAIHDLANSAGQPPTSDQWWAIGLVGMADLIAWSAVAVVYFLRKARRHECTEARRGSDPTV